MPDVMQGSAEHIERTPSRTPSSKTPEQRPMMNSGSQLPAAALPTDLDPLAFRGSCSQVVLAGSQLGDPSSSRPYKTLAHRHEGLRQQVRPAFLAPEKPQYTPWEACRSAGGGGAKSTWDVGVSAHLSLRPTSHLLHHLINRPCPGPGALFSDLF